MKPDGVPVTIAWAASHTQRTERTIQRWITSGLLSSYRTKDGRRFVLLHELNIVDRDQRQQRGANGRTRLRRDYLQALAEMARESA
jgi:hypothetical protein